MAKKRKNGVADGPLFRLEGLDTIPPTIAGVPLRPKLTKRGKKRKRSPKLEQTVRENQTPGFPFWPGFPGFPESVREVMVEYWKQFPTDLVPNTWVYSRNPPGFGTTSDALRYQSPTVSGQVLFDDTFYSTLPAPPLGSADPTYPLWVKSVEAAQNRLQACPIGKESKRCDIAREAYYEASRQYATALDKYWGLQRFQDEDKGKGKGKDKKKSKKQA
ncbi:hypothetical protein [Tumebacillus permanentifrigoris]|uniref:Uncharacterized protein n=1 Tax=Tumebacillus permanentifrigoris TaxID=378543 RepID=A0A316D4P9_9BACL|nr:hypothetical protein [Tumebacillus permanentifrigoris]PWK05042.1 hypothetical protein C7459_12813 [Tumebacillus permanentifrigoris]